MLRACGVVLLPLLLCSSAGCGGAPSRPAARVEPAPCVALSGEPPGEVGDLEGRARALIERACEQEPRVTALLQRLAEAAGGDLVGLEHRIKTLDSTLRKMRLFLADDPTLTAETVVVQDALRYTMRVDDQPAGNYVRTVASTLDALEAEGHHVHLVKNYWPPGDNYSGVNTILETPSGLPWELQFHTTESNETQHRTRDWYEELRLHRTPVERRRELFDRMTEAWDRVPIPESVLEPHNLHEEEDIRDRPRP